MMISCPPEYAVVNAVSDWSYFSSVLSGSLPVTGRLSLQPVRALTANPHARRATRDRSWPKVFARVGRMRIRGIIIEQAPAYHEARDGSKLYLRYLSPAPYAPISRHRKEVSGRAFQRYKHFRSRAAPSFPRADRSFRQAARANARRTRS